jgi:glucokinase
MGSVIRYSIGIDAGASNVRVGILDAEGGLLGTRKADIREMKRSSAATMEFIRREAEAAVQTAGLRPEDIGFISMGFPGTVDDSSRSVCFAPNLGWKDVHVGPILPRIPCGRRCSGPGRARRGFC